MNRDAISTAEDNFQLFLEDHPNFSSLFSDYLAKYKTAEKGIKLLKGCYEKYGHLNVPQLVKDGYVQFKRDPVTVPITTCTEAEEQDCPEGTLGFRVITIG